MFLLLFFKQSTGLALWWADIWDPQTAGLRPAPPISLILADKGAASSFPGGTWAPAAPASLVYHPDKPMQFQVYHPDKPGVGGEYRLLSIVTADKGETGFGPNPRAAAQQPDTSEARGK